MITYSNIISYLDSFSVNIESSFKSTDYFTGINSISEANSDEITFFSDLSFIKMLPNTKAKACIITENNSKFLPNSCIPILVNNPYLVYAHLSNIFSKKIKSNGLIHQQSCIDNNTIIGNNVQIDSFVTIGNNTKIGKNCVIMSGCTIGPDVVINDNCIIKNNATIANTMIGSNCHFDSGVVIGDKGFGFTMNEKVEISHLGKVLIGNNVQIGSNCTIDRATINYTIIKDNVRIDNLVHIAHNVKIGKNTIIAGQTGIAGSAIVGDNCIIGGQVGIAGHITIENNVTIAAKSGVTKNIKNNSIIAGFPAVNLKTWKKI